MTRGPAAEELAGLPDLAPGAAIDPAALEGWLEAIVPAAELAATPQDAVFHAEGDVWTHTKLAIAALVGSPAYAAADPAARRIMAAAVLLHDIGKPSTTRLEGEKLTSRGHSARGDNLARVALWRLGVSFGVREHVCALIRHHQVPFYGVTREPAEAIRLAIRLSLLLRNDWLTAVADADGRGRRCADPADQERIVDHCALWAEHCRELGVLDLARPFATPHTRRVWIESAAGARDPDVPAYDDTACEVTLMAGLPASGKDTWLRDHRPELPVISLDQLRGELDVDPDDTQADVIAAAREQARRYLRTQTSFAWNATNLTQALRGQLLELFRGYRARTHIVYCEAASDDLLTRNRSRAARVPAAVIDRMLARWTVPDPSEAHEVTYAVAAGSGPSVAWPPTLQKPPIVKP
ncbi:MAG TPA: AAA family ATPase [Kofleriaceae bacterium]|nr:AAA family ATPase [Kofleriaceae bacterium]